MSSPSNIINETRKAIIGKDDVLVFTLLAILAGGHILLEDIPGVGKTTMALTFSKVLGLEHNRVQFTPDVLPSDITGFSIFNNRTGEMTYQKGAVFCNLFLADELNRATSRTQSALLEAMEEGQVTVDGVTRIIPQPFIVVATQNPVGAEGTQMLPDSQLDRFMVRLSIGYPSHDDELEMLRRKQLANTKSKIAQVSDISELTRMRSEVSGVFVSDPVLDYIIRLVSATRNHPSIIQGASPRAAIALMSMAKAMAYVKRRDYALPRDVSDVYKPVIAHRLILQSEADKSIKANSILNKILSETSPPKMR